MSDSKVTKNDTEVKIVASDLADVPKKTEQPRVQQISQYCGFETLESISRVIVFSEVPLILATLVTAVFLLDTDSKYAFTVYVVSLTMQKR